MSASLRDLRQRAESVAVPQVDVSALVTSGERRLRRRRLAVTTGSAAVVLALVLGVATLTNGTHRSQDPVNDPPTPTPTPTPTSVVDNPDSVRQLTYAVGSTIRYGDRSIDVGRYVTFVDVSDNGVVFVTGGRKGQPGRSALWFTDGSAVVRIGTVEGSDSRGFPVVSSVAGTILVWEEPGDDEGGEDVVFDTGDMQVLDRVPQAAAGDQVLSVHDDAVYWAPHDDVGCKEVITFPACVRDETVVRRYDVATGALTRVSGASYDRDRRSRPRTIVAPLFGEKGTIIHDHLAFSRHGRKLLADGGEPGAEYEVQLARTGAPIRLRIPVGSTAARRIALAQWLDDDRVVLFAYKGVSGSELADGGDFFTCDISSGSCRLELRGKPGIGYQVPTLY